MKVLLCIAILCWPLTMPAQQPLVVRGQHFDNQQALHNFLLEPLGNEEGSARYQARYLKTAALLEYVKHAPKGARDIALSQMASPNPDIDANGLLFLLLYDVLLSVLKPYAGSDVLALACKYIGDSDDGIAATSASLAAIQAGGKDRLRTMIASERYRLSRKTRRYIETQLLSAPN